MHGFQPDRTKTGLLSKKLYRASILFSDKEATGRMVSHNKEAGQTVKRQHFPEGKTLIGLLSIYLFILQHPLSSIMCSCAVSARLKERL